MKLKIQLQHENAQTPKYATEGAACFDLCAATVNGMSNLGDIVYPGHPVPVPRVAFEEVDELPTTARGEAGFGSTGGR